MDSCVQMFTCVVWAYNPREKLLVVVAIIGMTAAKETGLGFSG